MSSGISLKSPNLSTLPADTGATADRRPLSTSTSFVPYRIPSAIYYIGFTENIDQRIKEHNEGKSLHTAKYGPWQIEVYLAVPSRKKALDLERYLKSGSGRAFLQRHIL